MLIKELRAVQKNHRTLLASRYRFLYRLTNRFTPSGKDAFISDVIERLNLRLVTDDINEPFPKISKERAKNLKPEIIILTDSPDNEAPNEVFGDSAGSKNRTRLQSKRRYPVETRTYESSMPWNESRNLTANGQKGKA